MIMEKSQTDADLLAFRVPVLAIRNLSMLVTHANQFLATKHTSQCLSFIFFKATFYVIPYFLFSFSQICANNLVCKKKPTNPYFLMGKVPHIRMY